MSSVRGYNQPFFKEFVANILLQIVFNAFVLPSISVGRDIYCCATVNKIGRKILLAINVCRVEERYCITCTKVSTDVFKTHL